MANRVVSLDSDVLIWYLRGHEDIRERIHSLLDDGTILICSTLVTYEVMRGMKSSEASFTRALLRTLGQAEVSFIVIEKAYQLYDQERKKGQTLPFIDSIIAATALVERAPLYTLNTKHYPKQSLLLT
jgi:tRNA(fMet)-specific endonuclease VapC